MIIMNKRKWNTINKERSIISKFQGLNHLIRRLLLNSTFEPVWLFCNLILFPWIRIMEYIFRFLDLPFNIEVIFAWEKLLLGIVLANIYILLKILIF